MAGLRLVKRGQVWHAHGTVAGERIRQSLGTRDRAQAEELCTILEARAWKRHSYGEEAVRTFDEAALMYMEAGGERRYLVPLLRRFKGRVLGTIKPEEVRQAARQLGQTKSSATRNRQVIIPVRAVINHAAQLGWCSPIVIKAFPTERPQRRVVDRAWIDAFLSQCDRDGLPHLAAAILFMWQTGTRVSEATRVTSSCVDLSNRIIALERTKTGTWEPRHITVELMVRIANLEKRAGEPLFGYASRYGIGQRMRAVCRRAGLPWVPPHQAGRHSFASEALARGATVKEVMEAGGWKTARMVLEVYAHAERAGRSIADRFDEGEDNTKARKA